jgi:hypothetical protein
MRMKHTAIRLTPYAINGVIHVDRITDPALKRLVKDKRLQPLIRRALKEIGNKYELLIPYAVDDEQLQLKRYVQLKLGTTVNISNLRKNYHNYYLKVCGYGTPADVLRGWGLEVSYDKTMTEAELLQLIEQRADSGIVWKIGRNSKLYQSLAYHSRKKRMSVGGYLEKMGYIYKGGSEESC